MRKLTDSVNRATKTTTLRWKIKMTCVTQDHNLQQQQQPNKKSYEVINVSVGRFPGLRLWSDKQMNWSKAGRDVLWPGTCCCLKTSNVFPCWSKFNYFSPTLCHWQFQIKINGPCRGKSRIHGVLEKILLLAQGQLGTLLINPLPSL